MARLFPKIICFISGRAGFIETVQSWVVAGHLHRYAPLLAIAIPVDALRATSEKCRGLITLIKTLNKMQEIEKIKV